MLKTQTEIGYKNKFFKVETAFISYIQNIHIHISSRITTASSQISKCKHHDTKVKPEAATAVIELLMIYLNWTHSEYLILLLFHHDSGQANVTLHVLHTVRFPLYIFTTCLQCAVKYNFFEVKLLILYWVFGGERRNLEDLNIEGKIILQWVAWRAWTDLAQDRDSWGLLWTR